MSQIINAVFEDGVFKPLQKVRVKDHEKVEIKILSKDEKIGSNQTFKKILGRARDLGIKDLSKHHDHYLYGVEKR